jgi:hypothetical protein
VKKSVKTAFYDRIILIKRKEHVLLWQNEEKQRVRKKEQQFTKLTQQYD